MMALQSLTLMVFAFATQAPDPNAGLLVITDITSKVDSKACFKGASKSLGSEGYTGLEALHLTSFNLYFR